MDSELSKKPVKLHEGKILENIYAKRQFAKYMRKISSDKISKIKRIQDYLQHFKYGLKGNCIFKW